MPSLHRLHPLPRLPHRFPPPSSSSSSRLLTTSLPRSSAWKAALLPSLTSNTVPTDDFSPHPSSSTSSLPDRIVALGVPFVKDEGFTLQAVLRGVREAGKGEERVGKEVLEGLFPDQEVLTFRRVFEEMTKRFRPSDESPPYPSSSDPSPSSSSAQDDTATGTIALRRALVQAWLDEARRATVRHVREKGLTIEKDGEEGVAEGFRERLRWNATNPRSTLVDALALLITHPPSSSTFPLPHFLTSLPSPTPYLHASLSLSTSLLHALHDFSPSTEWQMRRLRYGLVWMGVEVGSLRLGVDEDGRTNEREVEGLVRGLLGRAEKAAKGIRETTEFVDYVRRSQAAIFRSFGL